MPKARVPAAMGAWHLPFPCSWPALPRPTDRAQSNAPGLDPDRVLVVGSGPAAGWGLRSHELGLPGQLARGLAAATGRGSDVDVLSFASLPVRGAAQGLRDRRLWRYDAVVLTVGADDAVHFLPLDEWEVSLRGLLRLVLSSSSPSTRILVAGIPPVTSLPGFSPPFGAAMNTHAERMNAVTRRLCRELPRVSYVALPSPAPGFADRPGGFRALYEEWGHLLSSEMASALTASRIGAPSGRRMRDLPDDEEARMRAVESMALERFVPYPSLKRVAELARRMLGTRYAAAIVVERDRQWPLAEAGGAMPDISRSTSFCHHTIRQSGLLVVPDARLDDRFRINRLVTHYPHIRFYAGFPLESEDGYRVGTLCVLDSAPGPTDPNGQETLRSLAKLAQRELAALREHSVGRPSLVEG